jgi:hypothetical protein
VGPLQYGGNLSSIKSTFEIYLEKNILLNEITQEFEAHFRLIGLIDNDSMRHSI